MNLSLLSTILFALSILIAPVSLLMLVFKKTRKSGLVIIGLAALCFVASVGLMVPEERQARREGFDGIYDKRNAQDAGVQSAEEWIRRKK